MWFSYKSLKLKLQICSNLCAISFYVYATFCCASMKTLSVCSKSSSKAKDLRFQFPQGAQNTDQHMRVLLKCIDTLTHLVEKHHSSLVLIEPLYRDLVNFFFQENVPSTLKE